MTHFVGHEGPGVLDQIGDHLAKSQIMAHDDEPLGALDAITKLTMQEELTRIWREEKVTMVLVTHDLEEAIYLADRVLVMTKVAQAAPLLIDIDLPRPRDRSEERFVAMRRRLMAEFGLH